MGTLFLYAHNFTLKQCIFPLAARSVTQRVSAGV